MEKMDAWIFAAAIFGATAFVLLLIQKLTYKIILRSLNATVDSKEWRVSLIDRIKRPLRAVILITAGIVAVQFAPGDLRHEAALQYGLKMALIVVGFWSLDRVFSAVIRNAPLPFHATVTSRMLILTINRVILFSIGTMILLDTVGISITPLLASLGVGSVAVALALQDTLSNFFSGMYIMVDRPVQVGEMVGIDKDTQGTVSKIGWRSTKIELPAGNTLVVPNSKLASAQITNFDRPSREIGFGVDMKVPHGTDLKYVEQVALEAARQTLANADGAVKSATPTVRFNGFSDNGITFGVGLKAESFAAQAGVRHEFIKTVAARFAIEKIPLAVPLSGQSTQN